ncbi:MAG: tetratricopeptide repeat protein, partial [Rhizonema sp. PD38]|nr:tetratricopeptide repeat protein [Rhizonema sp. PD38]
MQLKSIKFFAIIAIFTINLSTINWIFLLVLIPRQALADIKKNGDKEVKKLIQQAKKQLNSNNWEAALQLYQQALMIYQNIGDTSGEADAFIGLGNVYFAKDNQQAINYYQQSLTIAQKNNHLEQKSDSLFYLANAYSALENDKQAINYYRQSLEAFKEWKGRLGDCKRKITTRYRGYKDCQSMKSKHDQRDCEVQNSISEPTTVTTETTDKKCQSLSKEISIKKIASLNGYADAYSARGDFIQGIDSYKESLEIAQEINDRKGKGYSIAGLGDAYSATGDFNQAIAYYQQSLKIAQK